MPQVSRVFSNLLGLFCILFQVTSSTLLEDRYQSSYQNDNDFYDYYYVNFTVGGIVVLVWLSLCTVCWCVVPVFFYRSLRLTDKKLPNDSKYLTTATVVSFLVLSLLIPCFGSCFAYFYMKTEMETKLKQIAMRTVQPSGSAVGIRTLLIQVPPGQQLTQNLSPLPNAGGIQNVSSVPLPRRTADLEAASQTSRSRTAPSGRETLPRERNDMNIVGSRPGTRYLVQSLSFNKQATEGDSVEF